VTPADVDATAHAFVDVALDTTVRLDGADGHHLQRVRRVRRDERITLGDGAGSWRTYRVEATAPGALDLVADGPLQAVPRATPPIILVFALTKGDGPETVVARATELGVDGFEPVLADHGVARPEPARIADRLERVAREAAAQSRRAWLPTIAPLRGLAAALADAPEAGLVVSAAHGGTPRLPEPDSRGWRLVVGPEGGFSAAETELLAAHPSVGVGVNVLRAVTAAVAVSAVAATTRIALAT